MNVFIFQIVSKELLVSEFWQPRPVSRQFNDQQDTDSASGSIFTNYTMDQENKTDFGRPSRNKRKKPNLQDGAFCGVDRNVTLPRRRSRAFHYPGIGLVMFIMCI